MGAIPGSGLSLGTLYIAIEAVVEGATRELQKFGDETSAMIDQQKQKWDGLKNVGQSLSGIGAGLSAAVTVPLTGLGAIAIKAAGDLEALRNALDTVTGSSAETSIQMARLKEIAKLPGLGLEEAVKGSLALQNVGISAQTAERYLKAFGNAIAAAGGGKADLEAVVVQLRQMGATGKVTAEDLKPILERVPQVAAVTKAAFGTIDTEKLQKAGVTSEQFLQTIVAGLEKLPPVTGGIKNSLENMGDSAKESLGKLGAALVPVLEKATPLIQGFLTVIGDIATRFTNLPEPVQNVVLALGGIATALGPVLFVVGQAVAAFTTIAPVVAAAGAALGGLVPLIGGFITALGPLAAALAGPPGWIAAITAALVALGVWIYANWDSIVAVLKDAWAGIEQAWTSAWSTITGAVTALWEQFKATVEPFWKFIVDLVSAVWNVVSAIWETQWKAIVRVVTAVWDALEPYVERVLGRVVEFVSDLWKDVKRLWNAAWDAVKATVTAAWDAIARAATKVFTPVVKALGDVWDSLERTWESVWRDIEDMLTKLWNRLAGAAKAAWEQIAKIGNIITGIPQKLNNLASSIRRVGDEADKAAGHSPIPELNQALEETDEIVGALPPEIEELADAISDLGEAAAAAHANLNFAPGFYEMQAAAVEASGGIDSLRTAIYNLDAISTPAHASLNFTPDFAALQAGAATAAGAIGTLEGAVGSLKTRGSADFEAFATSATSAKTSVGTAMSDLSREVSTIMTNLAQDISKSLWQGEGSWAEKGLDALKSLGQAVTSQFIQPFTTAIATFISGALADLLGKTGLGGILDSIRNIGKESGDIFGKATGKIDGAPAPGDGGGVGEAVGGALGQAVSGWITAISSVVSAVTDVIFGIQTEKDFDTLANHTLRIFNELALLRKDEWSRWGGWMLIKDDILGRLNTLADNSNLSILKYDDIITDLNSIKDSSYNCQLALDAILAENTVSEARQESLFERMIGTMERIAVSGERSLTMNLNGSDPSIVATKIAQQLRLQGAQT